MITTERVAHSGALVLSALVRDSLTPFNWYETQTFYGYGVREARALFREHLTSNGMKLVKD
jgi:hypothetical protein